MLKQLQLLRLFLLADIKAEMKKPGSGPGLVSRAETNLIV